jgi:hypothetical protein
LVTSEQFDSQALPTSEEDISTKHSPTVTEGPLMKPFPSLHSATTQRPLRPSEMPLAFILLDRGFWSLPQPNILLINQATSKLYLTDFKKEKAFIVDKYTRVSLKDKTYTIERSRDNKEYKLKFKNVDPNLDWIKLIEDTIKH